MALFSRKQAKPVLDVERLEARSVPATLLTGGAAGVPANADTTDEILQISGDGGAVLFISKASNLVAGVTDNNLDYDLFWRDTAAGTTKLVTAQAGTLNAIGFGAGAGTVPLANRAVLSRDGTRVAYVSAAQAAAVTGDPAVQDQLGTNDVFYWRADTGAAKLVSIRSGVNVAVGNSAGIEATDPAISDDGAAVAYGTTLDAAQIDFSAALDAGNTTYDLFRRTMTAADPLAATTAATRIPGKADVVGRYGTVERPVGPYMTGDGRFFVFATTVGADAIAGVTDATGTLDVFVRDMNVNTSAGVAVASVAVNGNAIGAIANQLASAPIISRNGDTVVFAAAVAGGSDDKRLVAGYTGSGAPSDLYARTAPFGVSAATKLVTGVNGSATTGANAFLNQPTTGPASYQTSADGKLVLFVSAATNLVDAAKDRNGNSFDVFVRNITTNATEFVSVGKDGRTGSAPSDRASMSDDGRYVTFLSTSPELGLSVADTNNATDAFLRDRTTNVTRAISTNPTGLSTGDGATTAVRVAGGGGAAVFVSRANNLGDTTLTNGVANLFQTALPLTAVFGGSNKVVVASGTADGQVRSYVLDAGGKLTAVGTPFSPFAQATTVRAATGDVNGDGVSDTVSVVGPGGGSFVRVTDGVSGTDIVAATSTYEPTFTGGLYVAVADIDRDGKAEIIVSPDVGGGARVQIYSVVNNQLQLRANFFAIDDPAFRGGGRVAVGDIDGDGRPDLVVGAGFGGGPRIATYDGRTLLTTAAGATPVKLFKDDYFAFPGADATNLRNGVFVAVGDVNGDGKADVIFGGGPGGGPRVFVLDGVLLAAGPAAAYAAPLANFFAFDSTLRGGVRVAVKDVDGDAKLDIVVASGERQSSVIKTYLSKNLPGGTTEPAAFEVVDPFGSPSVPAGVFVG